MPEGKLSTAHEVPLEDLKAASKYSWRARAVNADGEVYTSKLVTFMTLSESSTDDLINIALAEHGTRVVGVSSNFGKRCKRLRLERRPCR